MGNLFSQEIQSFLLQGKQYDEAYFQMRVHWNFCLSVTDEDKFPLSLAESMDIPITEYWVQFLKNMGCIEGGHFTQDYVFEVYFTESTPGGHRMQHLRQQYRLLFFLYMYCTYQPVVDLMGLYCASVSQTQFDVQLDIQFQEALKWFTTSTRLVECEKWQSELFQCLNMEGYNLRPWNIEKVSSGKSGYDRWETYKKDELFYSNGYFTLNKQQVIDLYAKTLVAWNAYLKASTMSWNYHQFVSHGGWSDANIMFGFQRKGSFLSPEIAMSRYIKAKLCDSRVEKCFRFPQVLRNDDELRNGFSTRQSDAATSYLFWVMEFMKNVIVPAQEFWFKTCMIPLSDGVSPDLEFIPGDVYLPYDKSWVKFQTATAEGLTAEFAKEDSVSYGTLYVRKKRLRFASYFYYVDKLYLKYSE